MEKCFCHIVDRETGEIYVVKDKEARQKIIELGERIDNIGDIDTSAIEAAFKAADLTLKGEIEAAYKIADGALQSMITAIEAAYKAADQALSERCTTTSNRVTRIDGNYTSLAESVGALNTRHWEQDTRLNNHDKTLEEHGEALAAIGNLADIAEVSARLDNMDIDLAECVRRTNAAENGFNNLMSAYNGLATAMNNYTKKVDNVQSTFDAVSADLDTAETTINNHETRLTSAENTIGSHGSRLTAVENGLNAHTNTYNKKVNEIEDLVYQAHESCGNLWDFADRAKAKINQLIEYIVQLASNHGTSGSLVPPITNVEDWKKW